MTTEIPTPQHHTPHKCLIPLWVKVAGGGAIALTVLFNLQDIPYFLGYRTPALDYSDLEASLHVQDWETANDITSDMMREMADVDWINKDPLQLHRIPCADLHEINRLWTTYSNGQYGFEVQRDIFLEVKATVQDHPQSDRFRLVELEQMTAFAGRVGHQLPNNTSDSTKPGYYPSFSVLMDSGEISMVDGVRPFSTPEMVERLNWCRI